MASPTARVRASERRARSARAINAAARLRDRPSLIYAGPWSDPSGVPIERRMSVSAEMFLRLR